MQSFALISAFIGLAATAAVEDKAVAPASTVNTVDTAKSVGGIWGSNYNQNFGKYPIIVLGMVCHVY